MKVAKTPTQPVFQPIELKITIESAEEAELFFMLCNNRHTVSKAVSDAERLSLDQKRLLEGILFRYL